LLAPEQLLPANAKLATNHSVAAVIGAGAGGFLVQWLTAAVTLGLNALSFLWSARWLRSIRTPEVRPVATESPNLRREIGEGLRYLFRHPLLRPIASHSASTFLFQSANGAVMIVFLVREIHLSPSAIGLVSMTGCSAPWPLPGSPKDSVFCSARLAFAVVLQRDRRAYCSRQ
jgi:hypothetical protein